VLLARSNPLSKTGYHMSQAKECDPWHLHIVVAMRIYRWLANTPRWLYQLGLGWVLGHRVVQITHRGRKSGQIRRTILEVLRYDPQTQEVLVVSGWEGKTDWYRNIEREKAVEVRTGWVHYRPVQEFLSPEETARLILTLFRQHPREVRFVGPLLGIDPDAEDAALRARLEAFFRGVRFRPADQKEREVPLG
jgi:deazaflavin-dependent oxidoreductase (nitroreductase family)